MGQGNGNNMHYVVVHYEVCTGDENDLRFDSSSFRKSREDANRTVSTLSMVGSGGRDMSNYRGVHDTHGWFTSFPGAAHLTKITVSKVNRESLVSALAVSHVYTCEHTKTEAAAGLGVER